MRSEAAAIPPWLDVDQRAPAPDTGTSLASLCCHEHVMLYLTMAKLGVVLAIKHLGDVASESVVS